METPHVPQSLVGRHHREHRQRRLNPRLLQSLQLPAQRIGNEVVQEDRQKQNRTPEDDATLTTRADNVQVFDIYKRK